MAMACKNGSRECDGCAYCYNSEPDTEYSDLAPYGGEEEAIRCNICFRAKDEAGEIHNGLCEECWIEEACQRGDCF